MEPLKRYGPLATGDAATAPVAAAGLGRSAVSDYDSTVLLSHDRANW